MKCFFLVAALFSAFPGSGFDEAVLLITGASCTEELDESTMERFRSLSLNPIDINSASRSRLLSSGLMNAFQVASLLEYRKLSGDIISLTELSLVDGFTPDYVRALEHFVRLGSSGAPGERSKTGIHGSANVRGAVRSTGGGMPQSNWGLKAKGEWGEAAEATITSRTTYSSGVPSFTASAAVYGRKILGKVVAGHFNARLGQGLLQWSGFNMAPYSGVSSLKRNPTGFSSSASFTANLCGIAADFESGRWTLGAAYSFFGKETMGYVNYTSRTFCAGLNATGKGLSVNWLAGIPSMALYGEAAWTGILSGVCGLLWVPSYGKKLGACARYSDGAAEGIAAYAAPYMDALIALSSKQFRLLYKYSPQIRRGVVSMNPSLRLAAKKTDSWRLEARAETTVSLSGWSVKIRADAVHANDFGVLAYLEAGKEGEKIKAYLRGTLFRADNWADRIWVYERDAPGSFNVPAYYGRGYAASFAASCHPSWRHSIYARVSITGYPWMTEDKEGRLEAKLQYQVKF